MLSQSQPRVPGSQHCPDAREREKERTALKETEAAFKRFLFNKLDVFLLGLSFWRTGNQHPGKDGNTHTHTHTHTRFSGEKMQHSENSVLKTSLPSVYRAGKKGLKSKAVIAAALKPYTCNINLQSSLKTLGQRSRNVHMNLPP